MSEGVVTVHVSVLDYPDDSVVVTVRGNLDIDSAAVLTTTLDQVLDQPQPRIVVDLSGVEFCDSLGFSTLIRCWRTATSTGREFVLANPAPPVRRILEIMGIATVIPIVDETAV